MGNVLGPPVRHLGGGEDIVALTFDDGPSAEFTPEILSVLRDAGAPATFFVVGRQIAEYPHVVAQVRDAGVGIGVHAWNHPDLRAAGPGVAREELGRTVEELQRIDVTPTLFRPPYGRWDDDTVAVAADLGLRTVLWSVESLDWAGAPAALLLAAIKIRLHPGAIVALHDGGGDRTATVGALPGLLVSIAEAGLVCVDLESALRDH